MTEHFSKLPSLYGNVMTLREQKKILSDKITMNVVSVSGKKSR